MPMMVQLSWWVVKVRGPLESDSGPQHYWLTQQQGSFNVLHKAGEMLMLCCSGALAILATHHMLSTSSSDSTSMYVVVPLPPGSAYFSFTCFSQPHTRQHARQQHLWSQQF
jgi:hypothetical protein